MMRKGARPAVQPELDRLARRFEAAVEAGDWDDAIDALDGLIALQPGAPALHYNKAVALRRAGRAEDAVAAADAALAREPRFVNALFERACALMELGRYDAARDGFERFLSSEPHDIDARLNLAALLLKAERPGDALERVMDMSGKHAAVIRAEALRDLGRLDEMEVALGAVSPDLAAEVRSQRPNARLALALRKSAESGKKAD
ncbi:tetratricopeptide repeat protein [Acuticoccus kandeliae]|uniref:tetratricopeptide repeat protein n=1 Tax=Acuticoccus kandeliae TaxID=2073160 RepID=UPI000D3E5C0F|nr:tetratricopeptide repeat protein [Acuticoccus kandeliae]